MTDKNPYMKLSSMDDLCDKIYAEVKKRGKKHNGVMFADKTNNTFMAYGLFEHNFRVLVGDWDDTDKEKVILDYSDMGIFEHPKVVIKQHWENPFGALFADDNPPFPTLADGEFCINTALFERIVALIIKEVVND